MGRSIYPEAIDGLTTFSDLLVDVRERVLTDWIAKHGPDDGLRLRDGGSGASAYSDAIVTYLAFAIDKCTDYWSTISTWAEQGFIRNTFARQAIPMTWDFAEVNPFSESTGNWMAMVDWVWKAVQHLPATIAGTTVQRDARARVKESVGVAISTDPPYYDNISYADLSDYFFVWLRRNLGSVWPDECSTLLTPKPGSTVFCGVGMVASTKKVSWAGSLLMSKVNWSRSRGDTSCEFIIIAQYRPVGGDV